MNIQQITLILEALRQREAEAKRETVRDEVRLLIEHYEELAFEFDV